MMAAQQYLFRGTRENFPELVVSNSVKGPILVHYWASWVGPCMMLKPLLSRLVEDYGGRFLLVEVNTDEEKSLAREHRVHSLPLLKIYRHGKVVHEFHGGQPEAEFRKVLDRYTGMTASPVHVAALRAYREGDVETSLDLFARALREYPGDRRIHIDHAKVLVGAGYLERAETVLGELLGSDGVDSIVTDLYAHVRFALAARDAPAISELEQGASDNPQDCNTRFQLAAQYLFADNYEGALQQLLEILRSECEEWKPDAHRGVLSTFRLLGDKADIVRRYRAMLVELTG